MPYPLTRKQWIEQLARETARMSYPGGMSQWGKTKQIVRSGTKIKVEEYFATDFPLMELWSDINRAAQTYDQWHKQQANSLEGVLREGECVASRDTQRAAVAAKFINTFMHQLMKYEHFKPLWRHLHLPLDSRVFDSLRGIKGTAAGELRELIDDRSAYALSYEEYAQVQSKLWDRFPN
jgi:hypothetical protein